MTDQRGAMPFEHRLDRLRDAVTRAVHVAKTLKIAGSPTQVRPGKDGTSHATVSRAELNRQTATSPEVDAWLRGLASFHRQLAESSVPDREMLVRQLERQVEQITDEINRASERSTETLNRLMGITGKAHVPADYVNHLEVTLRAKGDQATGDFIPEQSPNGHFSGLVINCILDDVQDDTLARVGQGLEGSRDALPAPPEPGRLEAPAPAPADDACPAPRPAEALSAGPLTPADLDELDDPAPSGTLKRLPAPAVDGEVVDAPEPPAPAEPPTPAERPDPWRGIDDTRGPQAPGPAS